MAQGHAQLGKLKAQVIGVSKDSVERHDKFKKKYSLTFPLVSDEDGKICEKYGTWIEKSLYGRKYMGIDRATFLIDKDGVVQHQVVNNLPLGRNIDEMLRMIDALQFTEEHGEVCPAGWQKGKKGMTASPDGVAKYLAENAAVL